MKEKFRENYRLSDTEFQKLWDSAFFAFDTNVLLNFYRYSKATVEEFSQIIKTLERRIWLTNQAAQEFHKRRLDVIGSQAKTYTMTASSIRDLLGEFTNKDRSPFLSNELLSELSVIVKKVIRELDNQRDSFEALFDEDKILEKITELFAGKVGEKYTAESLQEIYTKGAKRYENKTPPGYADKAKPEPDRYGDLVMWFQMMDKAKQDDRPIIFVSDDRKEDWWLEFSGKTIGPLPTLRAEFFETSGQELYIYRPFQFLEHVSQYLKESVNKDIIEEVKILPPLMRPHVNVIDNIIMTLTVEKERPGGDLDGFINLLLSSGYDVKRDDLNADKARIAIFIPNIADLPRRINKRFVSSIETYGLKLVESIIQYDEN